MKAKLVVWIASALGLALVAFLYVAANSGYDSRSHVHDAIVEAQPMKMGVEVFYARNKSLPRAEDLAEIRSGLALKRAREVQWDPARHEVVIAMDGQLYPGKRFAYIAETKEGRLEWSCRRLDMEAKYLPAICRGP